MTLYQPGCLLQKVLAVKAPGDLYTLAMSQLSYKERTNTTMVTKDWSYNTKRMHLNYNAKTFSFNDLKVTMHSKLYQYLLW